MTWLDSESASYLAWAWNADFNCSQGPGLITDYSGDPTAYGAVTSIASGMLTLAFNARVGGILLAFPAILAASLTLIEQQEDSADAREDARGAIAGGLALTVFAAVAAVSFGHIAGALTLAIAAGAWLGTAGLLYALFWWR